VKKKINKTEVERQFTDSSLLLPHLENPIGRQNVIEEVFFKPNAMKKGSKSRRESLKKQTKTQMLMIDEMLLKIKEDTGH
jgi:hypothetical protein